VLYIYGQGQDGSEVQLVMGALPEWEFSKLLALDWVLLGQFWNCLRTFAEDLASNDLLSFQVTSHVWQSLVTSVSSEPAD